MFDQSRVFKGDILLFKPKEKDWLGKAIAFFSYGGKYSHSAMYIGNGEMIESHLTTGVHRLKVQEKYFKQIDIYRMPHQGITHRDSIIKAVDYMKRKIGSDYDLGAFPATFTRSVVARFFGWKNFQKDKPFFNSKKAFYCSELTSSALEYGFNRNIVPGIHPLSHTPSDQGSRLSILKKIC